MPTESQIIPIAVALISVAFIYLSGGSPRQLPGWPFLRAAVVFLFVGFMFSLVYELSEGAWRQWVPDNPYTMPLFGNLDMICFVSYALLITYWAYSVYGKVTSETTRQ